MKKNYMFTIMMIVVAAACSKNNDGPKETEREAPEHGVVIGGVTWATRNVNISGKFVSLPEDIGQYFSVNTSKTACPEGWRLPTLAEFNILVEAESAGKTVNGINGRQFGSGENIILLPALSNSSTGYYWSEGSSRDENGFFKDIFVFINNSNTVMIANSVQVIGGSGSNFNVRCVKK